MVIGVNIKKRTKVEKEDMKEDIIIVIVKEVVVAVEVEVEVEEREEVMNGKIIKKEDT